MAHDSNVWLTPAGLDFERFTPTVGNPEFLRRELDLPPDTRIIGSICNLRRMKGIGTLLAAFERLRTDGVDVHLGLAGREPPRRREEQGPEGLTDGTLLMEGSVARSGTTSARSAVSWNGSGRHGNALRAMKSRSATMPAAAERRRCRRKRLHGVS